MSDGGLWPYPTYGVRPSGAYGSFLAQCRSPHHATDMRIWLPWDRGREFYLICCGMRKPFGPAALSSHLCLPARSKFPVSNLQLCRGRRSDWLEIELNETWSDQWEVLDLPDESGYKQRAIQGVA